MQANAQHEATREAKETMSLRNGIALTCMAIPAIGTIIVGFTYFTATEIMPYHKEFLAVPWSDLEPTVRAMLVGFLPESCSQETPLLGDLGWRMSYLNPVYLS